MVANNTLVESIVMLFIPSSVNFLTNIPTEPQEIPASIGNRNANLFMLSPKLKSALSVKKALLYKDTANIRDLFVMLINISKKKQVG